MSCDLGPGSPSFVFSPINLKSQQFLCSVVDLPLISEHHCNNQLPKELGKPIKLHSINGDGNCLYRALSYAVTGRQVYHASLRHKIIDHMREIESLLKPHMGMSLIDYLNNSGMANDRVWGIDVEIFAACSLLKTDIYIY